MINLHSPKDEVELALIRSILDGEGIRYFVHNENYGAMLIGPRIDLLNARTIRVEEEDRDRAKELVDDFLQKTRVEEKSEKSRHSYKDMLRLLFEILVFGWCVPGKRWRRRRSEDQHEKTHREG